MPDQIKNIIIGIFVLAALSIIVFIILFLHPTTGDEGQVLYVRFADIDKINVGTRVTLAGKPIGEVVSIKEIEKGRMGISDDYGHLYVYELKLLVDSGVKIYETDQVSARTSGLLGEKSVAIMPVALKPGEKADPIESGEVLYAREGGSVEDTMKDFKEVADKFDVALDNINLILDDIRKEEVVRKVAETVQNLNEITAAINKPEDLEAIVNNIQEFSSTLATRLPPTWDTIDEALAGLNDSSASLRKTMANADLIVAHTKGGEGTLGRLLVDEEMYLRLNAILSKGETVMNDVNHYGLFYNNDKGWQRLRARRMNLLEKLSSPQEFRNYFNDEIDQITTSLSRVGMVLDKVEFCSFDCGCDLGDDPDFIKVFAELLRRVTMMEDELKMYNQQIMNSKASQTELIEECY